MAKKSTPLNLSLPLSESLRLLREQNPEWADTPGDAFWCCARSGRPAPGGYFDQLFFPATAPSLRRAQNGDLLEIADALGEEGRTGEEAQVRFAADHEAMANLAIDLKLGRWRIALTESGEELLRQVGASLFVDQNLSPHPDQLAVRRKSGAAWVLTYWRHNRRSVTVQVALEQLAGGA